jgi:hypothetical protein
VIVFNDLQIWQPVGKRKAKSLSDYRDMYPECRIIFVGDSGQGDLLASEYSQRKDPTGNLLLHAAFIHQVNTFDRMPCEANSPPLDVWGSLAIALDKAARSLIGLATGLPPSMTPLAEPAAEPREYESTCVQSWKDKNIFLFKTYTEAAVRAKENGLITDAGVRMVVRQSRADLEVLKSLAKNEREKEAVTIYADALEAYIAGTPSLTALLLEEVRRAEEQAEGRPFTC